MTHFTEDMALAMARLIFHNTQTGATAPIGSPNGLQGASSVGNFWIGLFEGDPGDTQAGLTEANYNTAGGSIYQRVAVPRNSSNWNISPQPAVGSNIPVLVTNVNQIDYPPYVSGTVFQVDWAGICTGGVKGTPDIIFRVPLDGTLVIGSGVTPALGATLVKVLFN